MANEPAKGSFKDMVGCLLDTAIPCFGEKICYRPSRGGTFNIDAVFDEDYVGVDPDTEELISGQLPRVGIKVANLPYPPNPDDRVTIGDRHFKVVDPREDGQGGATFFLNEVR